MTFVSAVWLYFYRLFITDQQVGILDGMAFAIGLIAEVPSGALADTYGRDKMVKLGLILAGCGVFTQAAGSSFLPFFVGQSIMMIGLSLVSGADEALFFDELKFERSSTAWRKLVTRGAQTALIGSVIATVIGGWLHTINPRIPWVLFGLSFIAAAIPIWTLNDSRLRNARQRLSIELRAYFSNIKIGFEQFRRPKLVLYVPIIVAIQGLFYAADWGILRPILLDRFQFDPFWGSVVIAVSSLITVGALSLMHKYADSLSEKGAIAVISLCAAASLLLSALDIGAWGFVVILTMSLGGDLLSPFMSEVLNNQAPENQRATVLSVANFFSMIPYVLLAPLIGYLSTQDNLEYFLIGWALFIGAAVVFYLVRKKQDLQINI